MVQYLFQSYILCPSQKYQVYVLHWHLSPSNLIDGVHISQTKLISPRSFSLRCGPLTGRQGGGSVHPLLRSRFGLRRSKGLCFGKASTDEQQETSLSIYYQAILSSWRKALAFLIYNDSHLRSISFSHFVTPTWKETFVHPVAHLQRSE